MNADFVYEDFKDLAEALKTADMTAISERLIKQNMEAYKELAK